MFIKQINVRTGEVARIELTPEEVAVLQPPRVFTREEQSNNRASFFRSEADPLFFKWQAGEGTEAEWRAARDAIRARFPYPDEVN